MRGGKGRGEEEGVCREERFRTSTHYNVQLVPLEHVITHVCMHAPPLLIHTHTHTHTHIHTHTHTHTHTYTHTHLHTQKSWNTMFLLRTNLRYKKNPIPVPSQRLRNRNKTSRHISNTHQAPMTALLGFSLALLLLYKPQ